MKKSVFIDANIIMYCVGKEHPLKKNCQEIVKKISEGKIEAVTDVEMLQEILYRYWSIGKLELGYQTYQHVISLIPHIYSITLQDLHLSAELLNQYPQLSPRDSIHVAVMKNNQISSIYTADKDFEGIPQIKRLVFY